MRNQKLKEDLIGILVTFVFVFGFVILINFGVSYTGLTTVDFGIESPAAPFVNLQEPYNWSNYSTYYINFTFNVSDADLHDNITNCSVYLYKSGSWELNKTNTTQMYHGIDVITNNTINITYLEDGSYLWKVGCYDNASDQGNSSYFNLTVDTTTPAISNLKFFALNSSKNLIGVDETAFNFSNIEDIEKMRINFTITDAIGISGDIGLYFTANGTHACSLGNNQSSICYNLTNSEATRWIHFKNGTTTNTFQNWATSGDYINCTFNGSLKARTYQCDIDEHYNPNVCKHYPLNFSDVKWQSGANQRIKKRTIWKVQMNASIVPLDATEYKLDFRVNYSDSVPNQPLLTYLCNTTYSTGDPELASTCHLVGGKYPSELQDDGTKFRAIFTKSLIEDLGDVGYILIESDTRGNRYYIMKTAYYLGEETIHAAISTNLGDSYTTLADGYESELNINWFYNGTESESNVTQFIIKFQTNDTLNNIGNSSEYTMSWVKTGVINEPPIVDIIIPQIYANLSETVEINWTTAEPENNTYITNITLRNSTDTTYVASRLSYTLSNYSWSNSSSYSDGIYNLTVESCEDTTSDKFCNNDSHQITLDNTAPTVSIWGPVNDTTITCLSSVNFTYNSSDSPSNIKNCSLYLGYNTANANVMNSSDAGIEETVNQTFNLTFTVNDTWIYWKVGCYNDALLHTNSSLRRFYLSSICPPTKREGTPGSSSGMGSSGERKSSTITEMEQTIVGNVYSIDKLLPGETGLDLSDPSLSIVKIYLDSNRESEDVELLIGETRNVKLEKPGRRVYRYVSIESNLPKSFVNKVRIIFRLHKNWGQDIKLLRYTSSWLELETNKIDEDEYYEYYEAVSPGFSYFAITSEKIGVMLREEVEKVAQEIVEKPSKFEIWLYAMIPIIILVLAALVLLYYLVKLVMECKKVTLRIVLLGLGVIILIIPFSDEILYWVILPLSVVVLVLIGLGFLVWKYRGSLIKFLKG